MPTEYKQPKYDPNKTNVLRELREAVNLSQTAAAEHFGIKRADTVRDWEQGYRRPHQKQRTLFLLYLAVKLHLQHEPGRFQQVWNDVMVDEWGWDPLNPAEVREYFGDQVHKVISSSGSSLLSLVPAAPAYRLVGRDQTLRDIKALLMDRQSVGLHGKPGVGKTALAIALARSPDVQAFFRDQILWAGVGRDAQEADILEHLAIWASVLGISPESIDKARTLQDRARLVHRAIGMQRVLIVVDDVWNIEHAKALQVGGTNSAHIIATRLPAIAVDFAGEAIHVQELDENEGITLLSRFVPHQVANEEGVARELVNLVYGLPLGIVIIGHHLRRAAASGQPRRISEVVAQFYDIRERLYKEVPLGPLEAHPSQPDTSKISIAAAIQMSDVALDDSSRRALRALSIIPAKPNSFSEDAALAISDEPVEVLDTLLDASLVESGKPGRYTIHQSIHDYALLNLTDPAAYQRMATYYADHVANNELAHELLAQDFANITVALEMADERGYDEAFMRLSIGFADFLIIRGQYSSAAGNLQRALQIAQALGATQRIISCLRNLGRVAERQGDLTEAEDYLQEGLRLAQEAEFEGEQAKLLLLLGIVKTNLSDFSDARNDYERALKIAEESQDAGLQSHLHQNLGVIAQKQGNRTLAARHYNHALKLAEGLADQRRIGGVLANIGALAYQRGQYRLAEDSFTRVVGIAESHGHLEHQSNTLGNLGLVAHKLGDPDRGIKLLQSAISIARRIGLRETLSFLLRSLATLVGQQGDITQEKDLYLEGLEIARALGHKERTAQYLLSLGSVAADEKDFEQARSYYQEGRALAEEIHSLKLLADFDRDDGVVAVNLNDYGTAEGLFLRSYERAQELGFPESEILALTELGELYLVQDRVQSAQEAFQKVLDLAADTESQIDIAAAKFGLGRVAERLGEYGEAAKLGEESLAIYLSLKHYYAKNVRSWLETLPASDTKQS